MQTVSETTKRILVADDDPIIRHMITRFIEKEGYQAVVVSDGGAAYRLLQKDANFCGAIFDMMMPHLEGLDVIRFMNTEKRLMRIPIMMMTSEQDLRLQTASQPASHSFCQSRFRTNSSKQLSGCC